MKKELVNAIIRAAGQVDEVVWLSENRAKNEATETVIDYCNKIYKMLIDLQLFVEDEYPD